MAIVTERLENTSWLFSLASGIFFVSTLAFLFFSTQSPNKEFWKSQQWIGRRNEWFAGIRANLRSFKSIREFSIAGYNKFSKQKRAFAVPVFGSDPWIVLPPSVTRELLEKTDEEVDAEIIHDQQIQRYYTQGPLGYHITKNQFHHDVVRRQLTRKLPLLTPAVYDELRLGFNAYWGQDCDNMKKVDIYRTCTKIVSRAANRVFAGSQLCRNEDFLDHCRLYTEGVFRSAALINLLPKILRPVIGPLIALPNRKNRRVCMEICLPIVKDRLYHTVRKRDDPNYEWTPPVDALQWLVEESFKQDNPKELDPVILTFRIISLNMVAIHTTSMTISNAVMDLYSSPDAAEFIDGIRDETTHVLKKHDGEWTKQAINELYRIDSTLRESMRRSDLGWLAVNRMVTAPNGVTFDGNIHVPQGTKICVPSHAIHHDETMYPSPLEFDAFRFSRPRETGAEAHSLEQKNTAVITTSDDFLGFGHGRHACPGRFFASQELKLMLAYLVMNYDVEPLGERPQNSVMNGMSLPSPTAVLGIKKRQ